MLETAIFLLGEFVLSELQTVSVTIGILTACFSVVIGVVSQILSRRRAAS